MSTENIYVPLEVWKQWKLCLKMVIYDEKKKVNEPRKKNFCIL